MSFTLLMQSVAFAAPVSGAAKGTTSGAAKALASTASDLGDSIGHMVTGADGNVQGMTQGMTPAQQQQLAQQIAQQTAQAASGTAEALEGSNDLPNGREALLNANDMADKIDISKRYYSFTVMEKSSNGLIKVGVADALNGLSNALFGAAKTWIGFVAQSVQWILDYSIFDRTQQSVLDFIRSIVGGNNMLSYTYSTTGGFAALAWLGVALSLCLVVLMFAQRRTAGALGKLLGVVFVMALLAGYATLPTFFMDGAQRFSNEVGKSILKPGEQTTTQDEAMNQIWLMGVDVPWQTIEFGEVLCPEGMMTASGEEFDWFITNPGSRKDIGAETAQEDSGLSEGAYGMMYNAGVDPAASTSEAAYEIGNLKENTLNDFGIQGTRLGDAFIVLIFDAILGVILIAVAGIGIGFQIGAIIMWILGFFVLILALFPTHGFEKIKQWGSILAMTYFGQILVYVIILLILKVMTWFYAAAHMQMMKMFLMMIGLALGIKIMYSPIMSLFSGGGALSTVGGGIVDMGRGLKNRAFGGGYKGDSTQRLMPNPIRRNMEAKRMAKRQDKMDTERAKIQASRERQKQKQEARQAKREKRNEYQREHSITRAAMGAAGARVDVNAQRAREASRRAVEPVVDKVVKPAKQIVSDVNSARGDVARRINASTVKYRQENTPVRQQKQVVVETQTQTVETRTQTRTTPNSGASMPRTQVNEQRSATTLKPQYKDRSTPPSKGSTSSPMGRRRKNK